MTHCGSPQARAEGRRAYRQSAAAVAISTVRFLLLKMAVKLYRGTVNLSSEKRGTESPASTNGLSSERKPNGITYHLFREAMTAVHGITSSWHGPRLATRPSNSVNVTVPGHH